MEANIKLTLAPLVWLMLMLMCCSRLLIPVSRNFQLYEVGPALLALIFILLTLSGMSAASFPHILKMPKYFMPIGTLPFDQHIHIEHQLSTIYNRKFYIGNWKGEW